VRFFIVCLDRTERGVVPVAVLRETPTLLRCSLPPNSVLAKQRSPTCAAVADCVTTLPMWERDILVYAMERPLATLLYNLLLQKNATLLVLSDGGAFKHYGPFGSVLGTEQKVLWECKGNARDYQMHFYRACFTLWILIHQVCTPSPITI
jgi:hypothetical protein